MNFTNTRRQGKQEKKEAFYLEKVIVQNSQCKLAGGESADVWAGARAAYLRLS